MNENFEYVIFALISFAMLFVLHKMDKLGGFLKFVGAILLGLGAVVFLCLIMAYPTMWLWNYVMPYLFNVPELTPLRALALVVLTHILIGKSSSTTTKKD
jgi:hypothetical protein